MKKSNERIGNGEKRTPKKENLDFVRIKLAKTDATAEFSLKLFRAAYNNLNRDYLRIWWCDRYNLPPTDPRLAGYTKEELLVELMEYMIDNDLVIMGKDGDPAIVKEDGGIEYLETGIESFDEDEKWLAEQPTLEQVRKEMRQDRLRKEKDQERNVLGDIAALALKQQEENKDA